jgi:site-specific DNA-cytosine methylase
MHSATDLFCGAGGSSQGAAMAGVSVVQALNHWDLAVETHRTNFPDCRHETTDGRGSGTLARNHVGRGPFLGGAPL